LSSPGAVGRGGSASPSESDQRFPRSCRLTARRQFLAVYDAGRRVASESFLLFGLPNSAGHCRLGITVTRKLGGAVRRNRIKRRIREVFRRNRARLTTPLDLVVNARPGVEARAFPDLEAEFLNRYEQLARRFRT
jgi:ribonuclease P protein component